MVSSDNRMMAKDQEEREAWDQEVSAVHELGDGDPDAGSGEGVDGGVVAGAGAEEGAYTHGGCDLTSDADFGPLEDEGIEVTFDGHVDEVADIDISIDDEPRITYGDPRATLPLEEPSEEDVRAYEKMYRGDANGGARMLGLAIICSAVAALFLIIGLIIGLGIARATYGF